MSVSKMNENAENINPVQVTEVLGTGAEAHRLAMVGEWTFMVREADRDREPLVSDEVLAQRLRETNERYMSVFTIAQWGGANPEGPVPVP